MSFVTGLARMAVHIVSQSNKVRDFAGEIKAAVKKDDIVKAIQENDFALAYANFLKIENIIVEIATDSYSYPISKDVIKEFHWFVRKGINHWFKHDPFEHWITLPEGHGKGWETFLQHTVRKDMEKSKENAEKLRIQLEAIKSLKEKFETLSELEPAVEKPVRAAKKVVEVKEAVAK